jgi:hypothetical protein
MINIICLKWGTKYGPEYVNRLFYGVKRNTTRSFKFHCFTDDATGIIADVIIHDLPFKNSLEGWWNKVYLFSNDLPMSTGEKIFFVDLDTLITNNIDGVLDHDPHAITVLRDFYTGIAKTVVGDDNIGSGLMSWYHGQYFDIWDDFIKDPQAAIMSVRPHGDQRWIQKKIVGRMYWQDTFSNQIVSFKVHCRQGLPEQASIVCYHGTPSIPDSATQSSRSWKFVIDPQPWVLNHWKDDVVVVPQDHEIKNMNQYAVRYVMLPAREIFGMVGRSGGGYNSIWTDWSDPGREKREKIMAEYEAALDDLCGHYRKLEESVLAEGFRNPVVITCGYPKKRKIENLPPEMRSRRPEELLLLESNVGGSRLHVAQKHDLSIPCIVNDWTGRFADRPEITTVEEARMCYLDQPRSLAFDPLLGLIESFDRKKIGHHLGEEWSEDRLMPLRAPLWVGIMNKYGYRVENLPKIVLDVLAQEGVTQERLG